MNPCTTFHYPEKQASKLFLVRTAVDRCSALWGSTPAACICHRGRTPLHTKAGTHPRFLVTDSCCITRKIFSDASSLADTGAVPRPSKVPVFEAMPLERRARADPAVAIHTCRRPPIPTNDMIACTDMVLTLSFLFAHLSLPSD